MLRCLPRYHYLAYFLPLRHQCRHRPRLLVIEFADKVENDDKVFEDNGIKLIINPKSYVYLKGTELDFGKEGLNEGFKFNNPNVKDKCGCGESFNV